MGGLSQFYGNQQANVANQGMMASRPGYMSIQGRPVDMSTMKANTANYTTPHFAQQQEMYRRDIAPMYNTFQRNPYTNWDRGGVMPSQTYQSPVGGGMMTSSQRNQLMAALGPNNAALAGYMYGK